MLAIQKHWAPRLVACGKFDSIAEVLEKPFDGESKQNGYCFACGMAYSGLERCHIIARQFGGEDVVENLHCLCWICHKDSEGINGTSYWDWFYNRSVIDATISVTLRRKGFNAWSDIRLLEGEGRF